MTKNSIFFNHSFEKKRLKTLISWIHKTFGEKEALRVVDELKVTGFNNATKAGLSIGLHDLITPPEKPLLISKAQVAMNKTDQDFKGGKITATERSQRIIDTWHRTSDTLRKQVVDHFNTYDQLNSVYIMALSGARGNFSQVRQLIGMRGLMADPQGQIISFPIRSNFREGLTLTEYFISCSGARKGLVDTALRTADTGYLTRRLVDVSHQVVIKRVACNTARGIVLKALQTGPVGGSNKIMLALQDRLIGRVLAEDINLLAPFKSNEHTQAQSAQSLDGRVREPTAGYSRAWAALRLPNSNGEHLQNLENFVGVPKKISEPAGGAHSSKVATRDSEISPNLALKIACLRDQVIVRSSLTCACTHEVCQLCYGWSLSQGKLVSLGEAVGVIAAQSIGEPGTQLTMRTFHTGGVFSGDLLQDIRAPHAGKVFFPQALQGLLVRTAQGQIAFLIKIPGVLLLDDGDSQVTRIQLQAATMIFVRQGELIESNTIIGELAVMTKEGNQPIKSRQTLFAEFGGRVTHQRGRTLKVHKPETDDEPLSAIIRWYEEKELDIVKDAEEGIDRLKNGFRFIEPTHSLSLGVFRILATRVGAKATDLSNFYLSEPNFRCSESYYQLAVSADWSVGPNRLADSLALRATAPAAGASAKLSVWPTPPAGPARFMSLQKEPRLRFACLFLPFYKLSALGSNRSEIIELFRNSGFRRNQLALRALLTEGDRAGGRHGSSDSHRLFAFDDRAGSLHAKPSVWHTLARRAHWPYGLVPAAGAVSEGEQDSTDPIARRTYSRFARVRASVLTRPGDECDPVVKSNRTHPADGAVEFVRPVWHTESATSFRPPSAGKSMQNRTVLRRPALFDKKKKSDSGRRYASAMSTFRTPCYVLNTIAEQGDLVDENYKNCTSERLLLPAAGAVTEDEHALATADG